MRATHLPPAPTRIPGPGGGPVPFGRYRGDLPERLTEAWDAALPGRRRLARKAWMYLGAFSERRHVGFAIVDAGYAASAFAYAHDRATGALVEERTLAPLGFAAAFAPALRGAWRLASGRRAWSIGPTPDRGWRARLAAPRLALEIDVDPVAEGLAAIAPADGRPFHATWKAAGVPARLAIGDAAEEALAVVDFSVGYPPRRTRWSWASLVGRTGSGERFGLNLVAGFNGGLENACWIDGRLAPLAEAELAWDPRDPRAAWTVRTRDGAIEARFVPEGERAERVDLGLVRSRHRQPYGRFEARLALPGRAPGTASGHGVVEEHDAVW